MKEIVMKTIFRCETVGCEYYSQLREVKWPEVGVGLLQYDSNPICVGCGMVPRIESSDYPVWPKVPN